MNYVDKTKKEGKEFAEKLMQKLFLPQGHNLVIVEDARYVAGSTEIFGVNVAYNLVVKFHVGCPACQTVFTTIDMDVFEWQAYRLHALADLLGAKVLDNFPKEPIGSCADSIG